MSSTFYHDAMCIAAFQEKEKNPTTLPKGLQNKKARAKKDETIHGIETKHKKKGTKFERKTRKKKDRKTRNSLKNSKLVANTSSIPIQECQHI